MKIELEKLSHKLFKLTLLGNKKRERPWRSWNEGMRQTLEKSVFTAKDAIDKYQWKLRICTQHLAISQIYNPHRST
jgi:hypothetical protein